TVIFDKTGTLTLPEPRVDNAATIAPDLLECAARLALSSRHPLATAVAHEARQRSPYDGAIEEAGQGVRAMIDGAEARLGSAAFCGLAEHDRAEPGTSTIAFSHAGRTAILRVHQTFRPDAVEAIATLRERGLDLVILSADRPHAVAPIAARPVTTDWRGALKPAEEIHAIEALKAQGRRVLMVGDGLNDAPALAAAHVSLSPISAADITQAHADAVFVGERLAPVCD